VRNVSTIVKHGDESATSRSRAQIALLMVKLNIGEEMNALCPMSPILTNGDDLMYGLSFGNPFPSRPSLGVESSELG